MLPSSSRARSRAVFAEKSTKNGRSRRVPLIDEAEEIAASHSAGEQPDSPFCLGARGGPLHGKNFVRTLHWNEIAPTERVQDLRDTAATWRLENRPDIKIVPASNCDVLPSVMAQQPHSRHWAEEQGSGSHTNQCGSLSAPSHRARDGDQACPRCRHQHLTNCRELVVLSNSHYLLIFGLEQVINLWALPGSNR